MDGVNKMSDIEYEINYSCNYLLKYTDNEIFSYEFKERLHEIIDAAKKYTKIKGALE